MKTLLLLSGVLLLTACQPKQQDTHLRIAIEGLRAEVAELRAENEDLRKRIEVNGPGPAIEELIVHQNQLRSLKDEIGFLRDKMSVHGPINEEANEGLEHRMQSVEHRASEAAEAIEDLDHRLGNLELRLRR